MACTQINTDWAREDLVKGSGALLELANAVSCLVISIRNVVIIVGLLFMIYGAIKYLTSNGNPDKAKSARGTVTWALAAILVAVSLVSIINFIFASLLGAPILTGNGAIDASGIQDFINTFNK